MKNNTSFSDEEILNIVEITSNECALSLTPRQVINIIEEIEDKNFKEEDKFLALKTIAKIRADVLFCINHTTKHRQFLERKSQFNTIEGQVVRVKNAMYPENIDKKILLDIDDKVIESIYESHINELRLEMNERKYGENKVKKLTL